MNEIGTILEKLTYKEKDFVFMKPCLDVVLYWSGFMLDKSEGILKFYQKCIDMVGKNVRYFRTETMTKSSPLKKDTLGLLPSWLQETPGRRDIYMLFLESGSAPDEPSDRGFAFNANPVGGYIRLMLPTSFISDSVSPFLELANNMGKMFSFDFGQAGYAINWNFLGNNKRGVLQEMHSLANQYPGIDLSHPFSTKFIASKGIKCINWLTFLSRDYCDRLGGLTALRKKFGNNVIIHDAYDHGTMIQAGPFPEIGDINQRANLPVYHQVGRVLSPIRCMQHPPIFGPRGIQDKLVTEIWLRRFD